MKNHKIDKKYTDEFIQQHIQIMEFEFETEGRPESYARERYSRKRNHFYNKKGNKMKALRDLVKEKFSDNVDFQKMNELLSDKENFYYVEIKTIAVIPICKNDSNKTKKRKISGIFRPIQRPDIDNYGKFLYDSLHNVFYDDDCRIVSEATEKIFGETGKTIVNVRVTYFEE